MSRRRGQAPRPRGRPRNVEIDAAIHAATLDVLRESSFAGLTIDAVAARAQVTRPTIYRRYGSRAELVIAAVAAAFERANPTVPATGCAREDVRILLMNTIRMLRDTPVGEVIRALVPELRRSPPLRELARDLEGERRELLRTALRRGIERGEYVALPTIELVIDALLGAIYFRLLLTETPLTDELAGELVDLFLPQRVRG